MTNDKKEAICLDAGLHIEFNGGNYSEWYAGITGDSYQRLYVDHKVDQGTNLPKSWNCGDEDTARAVEKEFLSRGCEGGGGGGTGDARFFYIYRMSSETKP